MSALGFSRVIRAFSSIHPEITANQILMFIRVSQSAEGRSVIDLAQFTGMSRPATNRLANALADKGRRGNPGLDLFQVGKDPVNTRANLYTLSPKGRRLKVHLEEIQVN